ncbi:hypothetical protein TRVL_02617 [Trypanosoma vivax]|nr:hypothetical protein TRVL_02617 [Trypanosoma vivax]
MRPGNSLAVQFCKQGMRYEESSDTLWCSLCTTAQKLEIITAPTKENVLEHCKQKRHLLCMEKEMLKEYYCPVEINGRRMLLDHNCIYPAVMFGRGRMLLDDTLGCIMAVDVCGGVKLIPRHKYTVVELIISPSTAPVPTEPEYYVERPIRSRKYLTGVKLLLKQHNKSVDGESALMKRRRVSFGQLNM